MQVKKIYIPVLVAMILAVGILVGGLLSFPVKSNFHTETTTPRDKIDRLMYLIENEYFDKVDTDQIIDNTINDILAQLDPHSVYIEKNQFKSVEENMKGGFVGIGINFYMYKDTLAVIRTIENGPAERAGLRAGDRILTVSGDTIFDKQIPSDSLIVKIKGKEKTKVKLGIFRKSEDKFYDLVVTRDIVPIKSIDVALMLDDQTAYIKVNRFSETTASEFHKALKKLILQNPKHLILDLRDNGGGYVEAAIALADEFLKKDELIVITKDKRGVEDSSRATSEGLYEEGKLYVLINENSASASEILAGAIQDNDRGLIIGRLSYGKGLVQREMPLGDGSVVRLTVAQYYTPSGRSIQKPYKNTSEEAYYHHFIGKQKQIETELKPDSLKFYTKNKRVVYGGGGITPDILTEGLLREQAIIFMMNSTLSSNFVFEKLDSKRQMFLEMNKTQVREYLVQKEVYFKEFKNYLKNQNIHLSIDENKKEITQYLEAEFIRQLFKEEDYYKILLEYDQDIKKVLSSLHLSLKPE